MNERRVVVDGGSRSRSGVLSFRLGVGVGADCDDFGDGGGIAASSTAGRHYVKDGLMRLLGVVVGVLGGYGGVMRGWG